MQEEQYRPVSVLSTVELPVKLKTARILRGLSQQDMADMVGLKTSRAVRLLEKGDRDPSKYVERWAKATDLPVGWFYGEVA